MSIRDRIEAIREAEERHNRVAEKTRKKLAVEAKSFFAPVYEAFLEIQKEYGTGRGLEITVTDNMCMISKKRNLDRLTIGCYGFRPDKIQIEEVMDFSSVPDSDFDPIEERRKEVDSVEEAINIAIEYVGKNVK